MATALRLLHLGTCRELRLRKADAELLGSLPRLQRVVLPPASQGQPGSEARGGACRPLVDVGREQLAEWLPGVQVEAGCASSGR